MLSSTHDCVPRTADYYNPPPQATYESILLSVASEANRTHVPYRYWLADSWWYRRAEPPPAGVPRGGVVEWEPLPEAFPSGLEHVYKRTGWRVQAHGARLEIELGIALRTLVHSGPWHPSGRC